MRIFSLITICVILYGCAGYHLRGEKNEYLEERGIHKIYLAPINNLTFKPGVETSLYNAMIKKISSYKIAELVSDPALADAILEGDVTAATYSSDPSQAVSAGTLRPGNLAPDLLVTLQYFATLSTGFKLTKTKIKKLGDVPEVVWTNAYSRSRAFASNNQGGVYGTTATHINESEFERTLSELTEQIADDAHEGMMSMF